MIKFKFVGCGGQYRKTYLPKTVYLKNTFTYNQIKPKTFNNSIMKRLRGNCQDGTFIKLYSEICFGSGDVGIIVINPEEKKNRHKKMQYKFIDMLLKLSTINLNFNNNDDNKFYFNVYKMCSKYGLK